MTMIGRAGALAALMAAGCLAAAPAAALTDQRDAPAMTTALNELMQFAAPGRAVRWQNPETGNDGLVTALRQVESGGQTCWDYERSFEQGGAEMLVFGTACELEPGLWQIAQEGAPQPRPMPAPSPTGSQLAAKTEATGPAPAPTVPVSKPTYDRVMVREIQQLLTDLGYQPGPVDGLFGRKTGSAITAFQRDASLTQTGEPSPSLLERLRETRSAAIPRPSPAPQPSGSAAAPAPLPAPSPAPAPASAPGATQAPAPSPGKIVVPPPPPPPPVPQ